MASNADTGSLPLPQPQALTLTARPFDFRRLVRAFGVKWANEARLGRLAAQPSMTFLGYAATYRYRRFRAFEVSRSLTAGGPGSEPVQGGLRVSVGSDTFWKFSAQATDWADDDPVTPAVVWAQPFFRPDAVAEALPLRLAHADCLPGLKRGDTFIAPVALIADKIWFWPPWDCDRTIYLVGCHPRGAAAERKVRAPQRLPADEDTKTAVRGIVTSVHEWPGVTVDGIVMTGGCWLDVHTAHGPLAVWVREGSIRARDRVRVHPGTQVTVAGWLLGDAAIYEYQGGALPGHARLLRRLAWALESKRGALARGILAKDAALEEEGQPPARGREAVVAALGRLGRDCLEVRYAWEPLGEAERGAASRPMHAYVFADPAPIKELLGERALFVRLAGGRRMILRAAVREELVSAITLSPMEPFRICPVTDSWDCWTDPARPAPVTRDTEYSEAWYRRIVALDAEKRWEGL